MPEGKDPTATEVTPPQGGEAPPAETPAGGTPPPPAQEEDPKVLKEKLEKAQEELDKLRNKEMNFNALKKAKLSQLSEEEKQKLSERERALMEQQESLESRLDNFEMTTKKATEDSVMNVFSVGDKKLEEKMRHFYDEFKSPSDGPEQIKEKMKRAYILATAEEPVANPVMMANGFGGAPSAPSKSNDFSRTPAGIDMLRRIDPSVDWTK